MTKINCKNCKKEFEKKEYNQFFCKDKCLNEYYVNKNQIKGNRKLRIRPWLLKYGGCLADYNNLKKSCVICGWDKVIHIHHIIQVKDGGNSELNNLVGLCPNHHTLIHTNKVDLIKEDNTFRLREVSL